jgi:hypothetical protein
MKDFLKLLSTKSAFLVKLWPDIWAIPFAVMGFFLSFYFLRWIDPYAGTFDVGYLQALFLTALFIVATNAIVFLGLKFNFKFLWDHYKDDFFQKEWTQLKPWHRFLLFFWLYSLLFALSVVVFAALL